MRSVLDLESDMSIKITAGPTCEVTHNEHERRFDDSRAEQSWEIRHAADVRFFATLTPPTIMGGSYRQWRGWAMGMFPLAEVTRVAVTPTDNGNCSITLETPFGESVCLWTTAKMEDSCCFGSVRSISVHVKTATHTKVGEPDRDWAGDESHRKDMNRPWWKFWI